jgi:hypothetical protein
MTLMITVHPSGVQTVSGVIETDQELDVVVSALDDTTFTHDTPSAGLGAIGLFPMRRNGVSFMCWFGKGSKAQWYAETPQSGG